ncbi:VOC family protein [Nocardia sp. CDC159]|uniref:VOC family protein n=1 Tax=Nocardia pulmonis TaxID=2951408 RepID=A0A9X2EDD9_9NOCA|nr:MULTISPECIES: VOC family protein [Nocardia]MCM6778280.1 VOC family protein [Nocardia pulmonis]MCM6791169.1 VOC family protein [Nocardia sp. CDC159]
MDGLDIAPRFHHLAIQTDDVDATIKWYEAFLGTTVEWSLDRFSSLTHARLPGIQKLVELRKGDVRFHVFDRAEHTQDGPNPLDYQFQHVGIAVRRPEHLVQLREQWLRAREQTALRWARDEPPSDIVTDDDGMQSLYVLDPNGLELEFVYFPGEGS